MYVFHAEPKPKKGKIYGFQKKLFISIFSFVFFYLELQPGEKRGRGRPRKISTNTGILK